ncbi:MAG: type I glyceraldehyde-3-phosphate dehydrogenase [Actinobacteria bacterium]|nr:type I glyceraldehyde-3-phosphate dehydrogenase [Actinomycetota bacterium]
MAAVRVGINGFGRIGRIVVRALAQRPNDFEVVAVNDLSDAKTLAFLLKYDSVHKSFDGTVEADGENLVVNGKKIRILSERDPSKLPWGKENVQVVLESTGVFTKRSDPGKGGIGYGSHLDAGAKKVILSAPAKDEIDATIVMGVNEDSIKPEHQVFSNASCTTNCLAPVAKVLNDSFGMVRGLMTTIHAYTNDQRILDMVHSDLRRSRSAAVNIIPTTTGAARAVGKVIPALDGKLDGYALRVPVQDGSVVDLTAELSKEVTVQQVNQAIKDAAEGPLKGILAYCDEPIVSSDVIGNPASSIFDSLCTMVNPKPSGNIVKIVSWYDNEWGFSQRVVDLMGKIAKA